jgi:hypothetical protein
MPKKRTRTRRPAGDNRPQARTQARSEAPRGGYEPAEPYPFTPDEAEVELEEDFDDEEFEDAYDGGFEDEDFEDDEEGDEEDFDDDLDGIIDLPDPDEYDPDAVEYVPVFRVAGKVYEVPKVPSASIGVRAMELLDERGDASATRFVLQTMLGKDGYKVLRTHPALPPGKMRAITSRIMDIVMATQKGPGSGNAQGQGGGRMRPTGSGGRRRRTQQSRRGGGSSKRRRR